ncbi:MAG: metalloregulator ArsR/SmtB family transcription factor [Methanobacteriaceae archaeon]|jgi:ArsR family transcriptional regulator|nr:metalloregulator ArsR/SmtB family transcription factor [Candidatus Methanorudis spinitermitis]
MTGCDLQDNVCLERYTNLKLEELAKEIPSDKTLYNNSEVFKAISDPLRLKILYLLKNGELCACHIDFALKKPQSTISHHLAILKKSNLVNWRKKGKWTFFSLANPKIIKQIETIIKMQEDE